MKLMASNIFQKRKASNPSTVWSDPWQFMAFGFGFGTTPVAPGTFGTLPAIPLVLILQHYSLMTYGLATLGIIAFAIILAEYTTRVVGVHDHPGIVCDEIAGFTLAMFAVPAGWMWLVLGFVLFRVFDILKPWPIAWIDDKVKNGFGIVLDDLVAAVPVCVILNIVARLI
jgi:phosphatidylglycerophosphatase A